MLFTVVRPGRETLMHYFSCSGGTSTDSRKCAPRHVAPNVCFSSAGVCRSHSALRCIRCVNHRQTNFHARVGPVQILEEVRQDTLC
jgi:hypothetical protein